MKTYMTPKEAAAYLRTSVSTLAKRRIKNFSPKFYRVGRAVRYDKTALDDFVIENTVSSTSCRLNRGR